MIHVFLTFVFLTKYDKIFFVSYDIKMQTNIKKTFVHIIKIACIKNYHFFGIITDKCINNAIQNASLRAYVSTNLIYKQKTNN